MKNILSLLICAFALYACQKELSDFKSEKSEQLSLSHFFKENAAPLQQFTANASNPINVITAKGTKVQFPANAFVTLNNLPVTGAVSIQVK